jgi:hypothetical protein
MRPRRLPLFGLALALVVPLRPALAQRDTLIPARPPSAVVSWGKWGTAALAVGLTVLGIRRHNAGNRAYGALIGYCGGAVVCDLETDGRYADPEAEAFYQSVVRHDRAARAWLVAGQLTAVGSAALFVVDLLHHREPPNIPFAGLLVESGHGVTRVGVRIPVRVPTGR